MFLPLIRDEEDEEELSGDIMAGRDCCLDTAGVLLTESDADFSDVFELGSSLLGVSGLCCSSLSYCVVESGFCRLLVDASDRGEWSLSCLVDCRPHELEAGNLVLKSVEINALMR